MNNYLIAEFYHKIPPGFVSTIARVMRPVKRLTE